MPEDQPLPDEVAAELAGVESKLAGMQLPAVAVDRDQLMYRAGYAAAEEQLRHAIGNTSITRQASGGNRRRLGPIGVLGCSIASAAAAAAIAVAATLHVASPVRIADQVEPSVPSPKQTLANDENSSPSLTKVVETKRTTNPLQTADSLPRGEVLNSGWALAGLRTAERNSSVIDDPWDAANKPEHNRQSTTAERRWVTQRYMREEFLSDQVSPKQQSERWPLFRLFGAGAKGEAI